MYLKLFFVFFKIGLFSFGGGYAMIPVIEYEVHAHDWMNTQQLTDVVAVAGMSPGPIATNTAVFIGYKVGGIPGAIISAIGVTLPSLLIVIIISMIIVKMKKKSSMMDFVFYGLRPVITGLIILAAIKFAIHNDILYQTGVDWISFVIIMIGVGLLQFTKINPVFIILFSGVIGIAIYY